MMKSGHLTPLFTLFLTLFTTSSAMAIPSDDVALLVNPVNAYGCSNGQSENMFYRNLMISIQWANDQIALGSTESHNGLSLPQILEQLKMRQSEVEKCFSDRGEMVPSYLGGQSFNRNPGENAGSPISNELGILTGILGNLKKEQIDNQNAIARCNPVPTTGICTATVPPDPLNDGMKIVDLEEARATIASQIADLEKAIADINAGYTTLNFTCQAVCYNDTEKMKAVFSDESCNKIKQCSDCRSAFLSTKDITSSIVLDPVTGESIDVRESSTGRIGVLGQSCQGYNTSKSGARTLYEVADKWRTTESICLNPLGIIPGVSVAVGTTCVANINAAREKSEDLLKEWEKENKELLDRATKAYAELNKTSVFTLAGTYDDIVKRQGFWKSLLFIASPQSGALFARNRKNEARKSGTNMQDNATKVCGWISNYAQQSSRRTAAVTACTVYAGVILTSASKKDNPEVKKDTVPPKITPPGTPPGTRTPAGGGAPTVPQFGAGGGSYAGGGMGSGSGGGSSGGGDVASNENCGKLKGALCESYKTLVNPISSSESLKNLDPKAQDTFATLAEGLKTLGEKSPKLADAFSESMDKIEQKGGAANLPLGDRFGAAIPGLSSQTIGTLNDVEKSMKAFMEKKYGSDFGETTASSSGTGGESSGGRPSDSFSSGSGAYVNNQDLVFAGKNSLGAKGLARDLASGESGSGSSMAFGEEGISADTTVSLFDRVNDCTLRKQKAADVARLEPTLSRNRPAPLRELDRSTASENRKSRVSPIHPAPKKNKKSQSKGLQ
jgi:hypothetical protein